MGVRQRHQAAFSLSVQEIWCPIFIISLLGRQRMVCVKGSRINYSLPVARSRYQLPSELVHLRRPPVHSRVIGRVAGVKSLFCQVKIPGQSFGFILWTPPNHPHGRQVHEGDETRWRSDWLQELAWHSASQKKV